MFGIYAIRNKTNNKVYIGSTTQSFERRWNKHVSCLINNKHQNRHLQHAWNRYGESAFEFKIIEALNNKDIVIDIEQFYIDIFFGENCYNIRPIADSSKGIKRSKEFCAVISKRSKARKHSTETKERISKSMKEQRKSGSEWALNKSASMKGKSQPNKSNIARAMKIKTWKGFISPDGIVYEQIDDLVVFAKRHNLYANSLRRLGRGERRHYKGWRRIE